MSRTYRQTKVPGEWPRRTRNLSSVVLATLLLRQIPRSDVSISGVGVNGVSGLRKSARATGWWPKK